MRKVIIILCMLACIAIPLAAQGSKSVDKPVADASKPKRSVVYLTVFSPQQNAYIAMENVVRKYQAEVNPNFSMDMQYIPDRPAYLQKLKILTASNDMPDMFNMDTDPYANTLFNQGMVMDLAPVLTELGVRELYQEAPLSWGRTIEGVQIGLPIDCSIEFFWYNKRMFADAGVMPPKTFAEFLQVCEALAAKGYTPISVSGKEAWPLMRYLMMITYRYGGNQFLIDFARGKQKMSGEIGMMAAEFLATLGKRGYFQKGFASADYTEGVSTFLGGKAAMHYQGTWELNNFQNDNLNEVMRDNIGHFWIPSVDAGKNVGTVNFAAGSSTPISFSKAKFDDELKRFIGFMARNWNDALAGMSFSAMKGGALPNDTALTQMVAEEMAASNGSINLYDIELDPATNELLGKEIVSLVLGTITPAEFARRIDASIAENAPDYFGK
jgi:raffinose/stachyose/melibiose transport system substrate-binding protein